MQHALFDFMKLLTGGAAAQLDVVVAALDDGGSGDQGQLGVLLEIGDVNFAAVAHGGLDLVQRGFHVIVEGAGVGDVGS